MDENAYLFCSHCETSDNWKAFSAATQSSAKLFHAVYAAPGLPRPSSFYDIMATTAMREEWLCSVCSHMVTSMNIGKRDAVEKVTSIVDLSEGTCEVILSFLVPVMPRSVHCLLHLACIASASLFFAFAGDRVALEARQQLQSVFDRSLRRWPSLRNDIHRYGPPCDLVYPTWQMWSVERWCFCESHGARRYLPLGNNLFDRCFCTSLQEIDRVYKVDMAHTAGLYDSEMLVIKDWSWTYTDGWQRTSCI